MNDDPLMAGEAQMAHAPDAVEPRCAHRHDVAPDLYGVRDRMVKGARWQELRGRWR